MRHVLKLLDKMCKYEMGPVSIVEDRADTILSTYGQMDKVKLASPLNFVQWGYD